MWFVSLLGPLQFQNAHCGGTTTEPENIQTLDKEDQGGFQGPEPLEPMLLLERHHAPLLAYNHALEHVLLLENCKRHCMNATSHTIWQAIRFWVFFSILLSTVLLLGTGSNKIYKKVV